MRAEVETPLNNMKSLWSLLLGLVPASLLAVDYHADSQNGDDARDGLTPESAWRSIEKVNEASLKPGDRVLFHAGGVWSGQLRVTARGESGRSIVFQAFGAGPRPRIDTTGKFEDAVLIRNADNLEVRDLELTNRGEGDLVAASSST